MSEYPPDEERRRKGTGDGVERRATVLTRLDNSLTLVLDELKEIRVELADRPTRTEQTVLRRTTAVVLLVIVFISLMAKDWHNEECGPGARASSGIDYVATVTPDEYDPLELKNRLNEPVNAHCDISYPFHTHERGTWPSDRNVFGMVAYAFLAFLGWVWVRFPIWQERKRRHGKPSQAPPPPWDGVGEPPEDWDGTIERRSGERRQDEDEAEDKNNSEG